MLPKRVLGKTGEELSIIGFGGMLVTNTTPQEASEYVAEAIDHGVNYFDVAPSYGNAEEMLGPALEPYRKDVFLACKTQERKKEGAQKELERSLRRLRTDHFDLYQFHAVTTEEDVNSILGPGGALETVLSAKEKGLIRYIGFSAHSETAALKLMDSFEFDTILFPTNWALILKENFGPEVIKRAQEKNMGRLSIKALARTAVPDGGKRSYEKCWYHPIDDPKLADLALRFTLSQPVTAAIPPGHINLFRMALQIAQNFQPVTEDEINKLRKQAEEVDLIFHK